MARKRSRKSTSTTHREPVRRTVRKAVERVTYHEGPGLPAYTPYRLPALVYRPVGSVHRDRVRELITPARSLEAPGRVAGKRQSEGGPSQLAAGTPVALDYRDFLIPASERTKSPLKADLATAKKQRPSMGVAQEHDTHRSPTEVRDAPTCKPRPKQNASKGGGSKSFIPWCDRRR